MFGFQMAFGFPSSDFEPLLYLILFGQKEEKLLKTLKKKNIYQLSGAQASKSW